jgi:hypothetical protein
MHIPDNKVFPSFLFPLILYVAIDIANSIFFTASSTFFDSMEMTANASLSERRRSRFCHRQHSLINLTLLFILMPLGMTLFEIQYAALC